MVDVDKLKALLRRCEEDDRGTRCLTAADVKVMHLGLVDLLREREEVAAAIEKALTRSCLCRSSEQKDWHSPHCATPDLRRALARLKG